MKTYLIDDDDLALFLAKHLLQSEEFSASICTFLSAEAALATLLPDKWAALPQVIFLDLNMPVMNGWQFLDALLPYENELRGRCHIYVLTSSLALCDLERSKQYPLVEGLIHKPLNREELRLIWDQLAVSTPADVAPGYRPNPAL